jgi:hypothetical protein
VYAVSLISDTTAVGPSVKACPISLDALDVLLEARPELRLDGERPDASELSARVSGFWLPDEVILYIGLAGTSVSKRVGQYYRTPLGARKPHAGGWFLKLLTCLDDLTVHFAECVDPDSAESSMLEAFCNDVSEESRGTLIDPDHPFPFANLEWPRGVRKHHGIVGAKGELGAPVKASSEARPSSTPTRRPGRGAMDLDALNSRHGFSHGRRGSPLAGRSRLAHRLTSSTRVAPTEPAAGRTHRRPTARA